MSSPILNLSKRILELDTELGFDYIRIANEVAKKGINILSLGIGQPDFKTPDPIIQEAKKALDAGFTGYVQAPGIQELREAIARNVSEFTKSDVNYKEVIVLPGTKPAIYFSIMAYIEPGDEVLVPDPGFPAYESITKYAGGKPIFVPLKEENDFSVSPEDIEEAITKKTKMIVLNSPENPTGGMIERKDKKAILEIAKEKEIIVVSDEVYDHYVYDSENISSFIDPDWRDYIIYLNGFSKTYSMTGWRIGYLIARKEVIDKLEVLAVNNFSCTANFIQRAAIKALDMPQNFFNEILKDYKERRNFIYNELNNIPGIKCIKPKGSFYIFPNIKEILNKMKISTYEFTIKLLNENGLVTLPGSPAFPLKEGEGYLRLSYTIPIKKIKEGIIRLRNFIETNG